MGDDVISRTVKRVQKPRCLFSKIALKLVKLYGVKFKYHLRNQEINNTRIQFRILPISLPKIIDLTATNYLSIKQEMSSASAVFFIAGIDISARGFPYELSYYVTWNLHQKSHTYSLSIMENQSNLTFLMEFHAGEDKFSQPDGQFFALHYI